MWVDLQLNSLCQQRSDVDILAELHRLPQGLHRTYARVIRQIKNKPETIQDLARKCLTWVFYAQRPHSMMALRLAVSIEYLQRAPISPMYNAETILESCSNLLVEVDGYVRPIHYSVREFLTSPSQREISYIHADLIRAMDPSTNGFTNPSRPE